MILTEFNILTVVKAVIVLVIIAVVLALLLAIASKFLQVKVDERITTVISMLPGYNCGACGKAGCSQFGETLVTGESKSVSGCKVIKPEAKQKIKDYLDNTPGPDGSCAHVDL